MCQWVGSEKLNVKMFIWFVLLVSVNFVTVKSEHDHVRIWIKKVQPGNCVSSVEPKSIQLADRSNFNLTIRSNFYILQSNWTRGRKTVRLENLTDTTISIKYENTDKKNFSYKYFHTEMATHRLQGNWTFSFKILKNTDPWLNDYNEILRCVINTTVEITGAHFFGPKHSKNEHSRNLKEDSRQSNVMWILIVMVSIFGLILIIQSVYIIRGRKEATRNIIANRPPLPLPVDEVTEMTPSSGRRMKQPCPTAPPMPVQNPYTTPRSPNFSKRTYGNEGLDTSDETIRSPKFGRSQEDFFVPKKSYKTLYNSVEDMKSPGFSRKLNRSPMLPNQLRRKNISSDDSDSDEEPKIPGFIRRQIEVKLANLPPKPVKHPKPLPRAPATPPTEGLPILIPAIRTEPVPPPPLPPLPQRKMPAYPTPASIRRNRISDDEWQYEALKPSSDYLNNFQNSSYNNTRRRASAACRRLPSTRQRKPSTCRRRPSTAAVTSAAGNMPLVCKSS